MIPQNVVQAVAQGLGIRIELDREPLRSLGAVLATRQVLLVLDNCEHLVESCAELVLTLLRGCPSIRILATSREPLGVEGEILWRMGPLEATAAIQLFVERARAQRPDFDAGTDGAVYQVCRALDYLPLAIELAAARVGVLGVAEILPRLEDRFELLKRVGGRGAAARQQTLRAAVDWSYELLEPPERQLFRRLAVFAGPFDLAGANAMAGPDTLDVLARLVDKSLVVMQSTERGTRYSLLETLRSYACGRLLEAGDVDLARQRHLDHFLGRAESLFSMTETADGPTRELDDDIENLRGALAWCQVANPEAGLRLITATRQVWWRKSCVEGRRWAHLFLERCPSQLSPALAASMPPASSRPWSTRPAHSAVLPKRWCWQQALVIQPPSACRSLSWGGRRFCWTIQ